MSGPFRVLLDRRAEREFAGLPAAVRRRFHAVFEALEQDPFRPRSGCDLRVLEGRPRSRAVRVGTYRGVFTVVDDEVRFLVFGHRSRVYDR